MSRVLITGGGGMVGRNLAEHPAADLHEVFAPRRAELDLSDMNACLVAISEFRPDLVIHAAGRVGGILANSANQAGFLVDNLDIGRNIVLAARQSGVPRLLNLGSSCMYPRQAPNPILEESVLSGPLEPTNEGYALAKIMVTRLCDFISESDGLCYRTAIPCNLYGPHDKFGLEVSHMLPGIINKVHHALEADLPTVEIWGDGTARREFMYAADLAGALWHLADRLEEIPGMINLGMGSDRTVLDYYETVAEVIGWRGRFTFDLTRPVGMQQKLVDTRRQEALGWSPSTSLKDGIAMTYEYYLGLPGRAGQGGG